MATINSKQLDTFNHYLNSSFSDTDFIGASTAFSFMFGDPANNGSQTVVTDSLVVNTDIIRGNKGYSKLVLRGGEIEGISVDPIQKDIRREKYSAYGREFPLMKDSYAIGASQINKRLAGFSPYQNTQIAGFKEAVMRSLAASGKRDAVRRSLEAQNILAAQSIYEGKQDAIFDTSDSNLQYDFDRSTDLDNTVSNAWSGSSATIMADLSAEERLVTRIGRQRADVHLMDSTSYKNMVEDSDFSALADNRRFGLVSIGNTGDRGSLPADYNKFVQNGWNWMGWIINDNGNKMYIFVNDDFYEDDDGNQQELVRANKVITMASKGRKDRLYGPDEFLPMMPTEMQLYQEAFGVTPSITAADTNVNDTRVVVPEAYSMRLISYDSKSARFEMHVAPIFVTTQTDTISVLTTTI